MLNGQSVRNHPSPEAYVNLGYVAMRLGNPRAATSYYRCAVELNDVEPMRHINLAVAIMALDQLRSVDVQEAIAHAFRGCELTSFKNMLALETLAHAYGRSLDYRRAIEIMEIATRTALNQGDIDTAKRFRQAISSYSQQSPAKLVIDAAPPQKIIQ